MMGTIIVSNFCSSWTEVICAHDGHNFHDDLELWTMMVRSKNLGHNGPNNSRQVVGNYWEEKRGQKLGQVGPTFLKQLPPKLGGSERWNSSHDGINFFGDNFVPSWDEVEKSRQLGETFDGGGAADLWPTWPQVEKWCSSWSTF
jgi:hypothetical protein